MTARQRGFTLIEVFVGVAVSLIAIAAVTSVFLSQQRSMGALDLNRVAAEAGRDVLLEMETSLRRAGYGIDPRYAFDFSQYSCGTTNCRDSVDGPDNVVFVARDPRYRFNDASTCSKANCFVGNAWELTATAASQVTVNLASGAVLEKGRVLEFVCWDGSGTQSTMGTVDTAVVGDGSSKNVSLVAASSTNPYKANNFTAACFASANLTEHQGAVFLVDRFHYLIQTYSGVPWLVLDTGLDLDKDGTTPENGADVDDYIPIAPGVEDLQLAYTLNPMGASPGLGPDLPSSGGSNQGNWIVADYATGTSPTFTGQVEQPDATYSSMPIYSTPPTDALRLNKTAANIRGVRVSLSVRSLTTDKTKGSGWTGDVEPRLANRSTATLFSGGRFRRFSFSSSVAVRAMEAHSNFVW